MFFGHAIRHWFRHIVGQKVREKVAEAAREKMSEASPDEQQPRPCDLGIVFALAIESGCLEDLLADKISTRGDTLIVREGVLEDRNVALIISGPGRERAARATEALIDGHRPDWVLSAGFAGGLAAGLKRRDVLMADHVIDTAGNQLSIDLKVDPDSLVRLPGVHVGRLLTAESVICRADEKRSLGQQHEALAVDMETFAVAEVCRRRGVRFLAVRVINDTVDDELPHDIEPLLAQETTLARIGAAVGSIWHRPASFKDIYGLRENALLASDRLAKFIAGMIEQL